MEPSTTGGSSFTYWCPGFLATLCIPVVTTSKNLLQCLHPNAHSQAAEAELRDESLSFQERGVEEGEITGLDSCVWIFTVVSKSIIWGNRVKDEWKAGSLPSACAGTVIYEAASIIRWDLLLKSCTRSCCWGEAGAAQSTESQQQLWGTGSHWALLCFFLASVVSITKKSSLGFWKIVGGNVT